MTDILSPEKEPETNLLDTFELTDMQRHFVRLYVERGGKARDAAENAGYATGGAASNLLSNPRINQAIQELTLLRITSLAPTALQTVLEMSRSARSEYVRLQAAQDLLDRAGFKPPDRVQHSVKGSMNINLNLGNPPEKTIQHTSPDTKEGG